MSKNKTKKDINDIEYLTTKNVKQFGDSSHVILPKTYINRKAQIIIYKDDDKQQTKVKKQKTENKKEV